MTLPTVVAFSWGPDQYHRAARELANDCEDFGLPHRIRVGIDLEDHFLRKPGEWKARKWVCRFIPTFLLQELTEPGHSNLLYIHADFRIRDSIPPESFEGMDIGLQHRWFWKPESDLGVLAAPIFVRNNRRAVRFLRLWEAYCLNIDDGNFEHMHLYRVWRLMKRTDRSIRLRAFDPPIASVGADAGVPIVGHKR